MGGKFILPLYLMMTVLIGTDPFSLIFSLLCSSLVLIIIVLFYNLFTQFRGHVCLSRAPLDSGTLAILTPPRWGYAFQPTPAQSMRSLSQLFCILFFRMVISSISAT